MTFFDQVIQELRSDPRLPILLSACSEGDISVLVAMLDTINALGTTTKGSPNSDLWGCFEDHGWMAKSQTAEATETNLPIEMLSYELTDQGRRAVPIILSHALS